MEKLIEKAPGSKKPTVSVIVPVNYGGNAFLRCLSSLKRAAPLAEEVVVVVDGATDDSRQLAERFGMQVFTINKPSGPAKARNLGARNSKGDILFFTDADVIVPSDIVERIVVVFQKDPDLAAFFGSYDDAPSETNFLSQYKNLFHHYVHQNSNESASTFWTGCGAIRRDVFMQLGGFDERYRLPSIEDIELGYRLKKAGYKIRFYKEFMVKHLKHWGFWSLLKTDFFNRALPWTTLILKSNQFIDDLNLKRTSRISVIAVYIMCLSAVMALLIPWFLMPAVLSALALLSLNRDLYLFFMKKRGIGFTVKALFWHWFYYFYSGMAFAIGYIRYQIKQ
jgi:GT2 family glycosyltransferase